MAPPAPSVVGQHLFTPVSHPELRKLGRKSIHTFLQEREHYLLKVADTNISGASINVTTLKASFDTDLLMNLVMLNEFPGAGTIAAVTEEQLNTLLFAKDQVELQSMSLDDLEPSILSTVRINLHEPDASLRIMSLSSDYTTLLRSKNWRDLITSKPKMAIGIICKLLKPPALQARINNDL